MATTHHLGPFALGHIEKVPNALMWTTPDATPPTSATQLNREHLETRPVELGHLCITSTGYFYRCIDVANQEALVWEILADVAGTTAEHEALEGTAVHGLGTMSTEAETNYLLASGARLGAATQIQQFNSAQILGQLITSNSSGVVRKFSSSISTTTAAMVKMGEVVSGGGSRNIAITGSIFGISGSSVGQTDFTISIRTAALPSKSTTFWEARTRSGRQLDLMVYEDLLTDRIVIGFMPSLSIQSFGWDITVYERTDYGGVWTNQDVFAELDTTGLTLMASGTSIYNLAHNGNTGVNTDVPAGKLHITSGTAATIGQIIQLAATPTANAQEVRNSAGAVLSATRPDGSWQPPQIADAAAVNNSLYYSTTLSKLVYKDPAGVVNPLY